MFHFVVVVVKFKGREMLYYVIPRAPIGPRELEVEPLIWSILSAHVVV